MVERIISMTFTEKQQKLIETLKVNNYPGFRDKDDAFDFIGAQFDSFTNYANSVIHETIMMPIWRNRYEGQDLRDKIQDCDRSRRIAHDSAISGINILNRVSDKLGLPPFADIDTTDRFQVADFVGAYMNEVYNNGIGKTFDDAVNKSSEYDTTKTANRFHNMDISLEEAVDELTKQSKGGVEL